MPVMLNNENGDAERYSIADILGSLAVVSRGNPSLTTNHHNLHPAEVAMRLLRDVAILHGHDEQDEGASTFNGKEDDNDHIEQADVLVHRIRTNDPKLTTLALKNIRVLDRGKPVSFFRGFTERSIQQATEALRRNHTIRSVSCRYDWRYPRRILHLLRNDDEEHNEEKTENDDNRNLRATSFNQVTKLQERRFFEACVCLPHLESISLTGGNRWRISHLITILENAKGLKKLVVRDVLVKQSTELNGLKRLLTRRNFDPFLLESIELTVEDQTDRNDKYWSTAATMNNDSSPFDGLLESLISSPNIKEIKLSKSILSRFHLRPVHDVSTRTLLKLARCKSLSKLVLSGISVEQGGIEAMCESLIQKNGHLTHLEFSGCAFNNSVGQAGWNAMFRLVDHDPTIQIRASSLVYQQRRNQTEPDDAKRHNNNSPGEEEVGLSAFVRRPREDFSFSLRDKDGAKKHFRNRGLDVRYMLQEAGFFRLLRSREQSRSSDWIDVMAKVRDDSIALFCILRENPALCDVNESTKRYLKVRGDDNGNGYGRERKRRKVLPPPTHDRWQAITGPDRSDISAARASFSWQCLCSSR